MEVLKQQLHFLSKKSVDKHNKLKLHTWQPMYYTKEEKKPNKTKRKKVCFHKKQSSFIL